MFINIYPGQYGKNYFGVGAMHLRCRVTLYSCSEFGQSLAAVATVRFEIQKYT